MTREYLGNLNGESRESHTLKASDIDRIVLDGYYLKSDSYQLYDHTDWTEYMYNKAEEVLHEKYAGVSTDGTYEGLVFRENLQMFIHVIVYGEEVTDEYYPYG